MGVRGSKISAVASSFWGGVWALMRRVVTPLSLMEKDAQ
jgi:hypothetical protein